MKKLLFIALVAIFSLASCGTPTPYKPDLPIEVTSLKEVNKFDTLLVIETDARNYYFNQTGEYVRAESKDDGGGEVAIILIMLLVFCFFIFLG